MQCGIACPSMICSYYNKEYSVDTLSQYCFATTEGVSLLGMSKAADKLGLHSILRKIVCHTVVESRVTLHSTLESKSFCCTLIFKYSPFLSIKPMKYLLFISLILFYSCHSGSSKKELKAKTDSIRLQEELCSLHQYVDSIIKSDTTLQQRFHCLGAAMGADKVSVYFLDIPTDSFEFFKSAFKKEVFDSPLLEFDIMSDFTNDIEIIPINENS